MSTHFNDIEAALNTQLATIQVSEVPPIAWPNDGYEPILGTDYLRPTLLPSSNAQVSLGSTGKDKYVGIYQVDVFYGKGEGRSAFPDQIADLFKRGTVLTYNGVNVVISSATPESISYEESWCMAPVSVTFYAYTEART